MRLAGGEGGGTVLAGGWSPTGELEVTDPAAYRRDPPPNVTLTIVTVEVRITKFLPYPWVFSDNNIGLLQ